MSEYNEITIAGRRIGAGRAPYIIAEMSGNHEGSLQRARAIIEAAAAAGADAIKLQTYTADTMTIDCDSDDFLITGDDSPWEGRRLYELYQEAYTPWEWHEELFAHAQALGITCFSAPFDPTAVQFLDDLGCPAFKIASFENNWPELIAAAARTGKPMIISTGAADLATIEQAVRVARGNGCKELLLLKCTSSYPADASDAHLHTIPHMAQAFDCPVGLSDHTLGIGVPLAAIALGAVAIEKHVTLSAEDTGVDSSFSLDPQGLALLVSESRRAHAALGGVQYGVSKGEKGATRFKRSIYLVRDMQAGERIDADSVRVIRPGHGLPPAELPRILGRKLERAAKRGTPVSDALFLPE